MADTSTPSIDQLASIAFPNASSSSYYTPSSFAQTYGQAAQSAGQQLGVDPSIILGHWGQETGWGKSVIPGTNNLGNIKDPRGQGPTATDNATGSTDSYQSYQNPQQFANSYASFVKSNYPKAVNAGTNANAFFGGLQAGGYAQDPKYVSKGVAATNTVAKAPGFLQTIGNAAASAISGTANAAEPDLDQLAAIAFPNSSAGTTQTAQQQPQSANSTGSFWSDVGQGINTGVNGVVNAVSHPIDTATSIYNGVKGNLSQAVQNPGAYAKGIGASLVNNIENGIAAQANASPFASQQQQQALQQDATNRNITAGTANPNAFNAGQSAGNFAQNAALAVAAPEAWGVPGLAGKAVLGAGVQTGASALQNGATGGQALGQALVGSAAAAPVAGAGSLVGKAIGKTAGTVAGATSADAQAAKGAAQAAVQANGFSSSDLNIAQKLAARIDQTSGVTGQGVDDVANELTAKAQNQVPGYQPTAAESTVNPVIQSAQRGLENQHMEGLDTRAEQNADANTAHIQNQAAPDSTISDLQNQTGDTPMQNLVDQWNNVKGTPEQSANLELQRIIDSRPMYQQVFDQASAIPVEGDLEKILNTPAGKIAVGNTEKFRANSLNDTPMINDGAIQPQDLNQVKIEMDNLISRMSNPADTEANALKFQKNAIIGLRNRLDGILDVNVPGFSTANKVYQTATEQMQASRFLTDPQMTDAFGNMNLNRLKALNDSIQAGQANNDPFDPAKLVSPAKVNQLQQMQKDLAALKQAKGTVGTSPDGQLSVNSASNPAAFNQYGNYLRGQGQGDVADAMQQLAQHQNYGKILDKIDARQSNSPAWNDVAKINQQDGLYTPEQTQALQGVRQNLINSDSYKYKNIKGSPTTNKQADIQNVNELVGKTGVGKYISSAEGERAMRMAADGAIGAAHVHGLGAIGVGWGLDKGVSWVANKVGASAQQANTQSLEHLMLNPDRLAEALKVGKQMNDAAASKAATGAKFNKLIGQTTRGGLLGGISGSRTPQP
ncbi:glucosaminidase domain-containing protein [Burkholderia guangdongensis]|uniref:glucosaminidase domain-containing protein n=1 Tax=Burkholderia guangdongensis TaxID=1792500 RepID=UPI0015C86FF8|nr:glucosaminidase domain-containing protein [Burkholderia guangdongensis]